MKFATRAIHEGIEADKSTGALMPPIYMTSTYLQEAPGATKGYDYTRAGNPNFTVAERQLAALEEGSFATLYSSGLGALSALLSSFNQGDTVLAFNGIYGGTFRLLDKVFQRFGLHYRLINGEDEGALAEALDKKPALLLFETPNNPLLGIHDIEVIAKQAKERGVTTCVDNTFATPYFQKPLTLGADIVWQSCTKYLGGHSDIIGGALITNSREWKSKFDFARMTVGLNPSPFDAWLLSRSMKTLPLRMEKHAQNAGEIVSFLKDHPLVKTLYYPGMPSHPRYSVAQKQMSGFSGIVSAEFNLTLEQTKKLISSFKLFALAESLGGIESLVCHPSTMTHASIPKEKREEMKISDGLVRFSVGLEDIEDLKKDLTSGLASC
ncbi:trans-sulfuration enzyme family protein [Estrella lausannensis]|uniref:L-methionine gamma-lyase n=1 Tax=Estrella lausannensis TaxID=483423 RepID=A0A0H5DQ04_9BACT|nr:PLP-dependent aspartate aminotransferase family protein [Estrella lausannensis]CRX38113.1 Cystathionine gamma-lyase [Estrella lausannensis]